MRVLAFLTGCALLAATGIVHGLWTDRWLVSDTLADSAARLQDVPTTVGDWLGTDVELPPEGIARARIAGYCARMYENRRKREAVTVFLVCGRPGPVSVHTPDVCYQGIGYEPMNAPIPLALQPTGSPTEAKFRTIVVRNEGPVNTGEARVFWAWNASGRWEVPDNPRWAFARKSALYKLYVIREKRPREPGKPNEDPCVAFLNAFLPELDRVLRLSP